MRIGIISLVWVGLQVLNCEGQVLEANQSKNLEGIWLGSISIPNRTLRMAFEVSRKTTGSYSATLSSLDQQDGSEQPGRRREIA